MARKKSTIEKEYNVLLANMRELLKTSSGKSVIWHLLSICNLYTPSFSGTGELTHYMEGKRSVGLELLQLLEDADGTAYPRLLLEKQNLGAKDGRTSSSTSNGTDPDYTPDGADIDSDTGVAAGN